MARKAAAPVEEPEVEETEEEESAFRSQMWKHEAMVEWLSEQVGQDINELSAAEIIALAFAKRVAWRKSDEYVELVNEYKANRPEKKVSKRAAAEEEEGEEEEEAPPAKKATAKKSAPSKAAAPAKAVRKATKASKGGENPFD